MQRCCCIGKHLLGQLLGAVVVTGSTADVSIDVAVVAAERPLGGVVHTTLLGHRAEK